MASKSSTLLHPLHVIAARTHGDELRAGRVTHGLTQAEAANLVGVSKSTYIKWEHGERHAPESVREKLAELWGLERGRLGLDPERACPCCGVAY